jgi:hypothetical protein
LELTGRYPPDDRDQLEKRRCFSYLRELLWPSRSDQCHALWLKHLVKEKDVSVQSAHPSGALRRYVRAYAQRDMRIMGSVLVEPVPPRLEQLLEFEFGDLFYVCFCDGQRIVSPRHTVIGLQTHLCAEIRLTGQIQTCDFLSALRILAALRYSDHQFHQSSA